jgi:hypothetical protein
LRADQDGAQNFHQTIAFGGRGTNCALCVKFFLTTFRLMALIVANSCDLPIDSVYLGGLEEGIRNRP